MMSANNAEVLFTVKDVASLMGVSVWCIYRWHSRGLGPHSLLAGNRVRYRPRDVYAWLERHKLEV
jgi:excisionase family DNA binding protein